VGRALRLPLHAAATVRPAWPAPPMPATAPTLSLNVIAASPLSDSAVCHVPALASAAELPWRWLAKQSQRACNNSFLPASNPSCPLALAAGGPALTRLLALEGVQDPGNLGTLLRTACAFGWDAVLLLPGCCDPYNDKALRASRGAAFKLPVAVATAGWPELLELAAGHGMKLIAAEPELQGACWGRWGCCVWVCVLVAAALGALSAGWAASRRPSCSRGAHL
jgi:hypothetical protein